MPKKRKLGHDPLDWLNADDAAEIQGEALEKEQSKEQAKEQVKEQEMVSEDITPEQAPEMDTKLNTNTEDGVDLEGVFGLFDDEEDTAEVKTHHEVDLDGVFGLFDDDEDVTSTDVEGMDINLPSTLTITSVNALHEEMSALLAKSDIQSVSLNVSTVSTVDGAGLQLLWGFNEACNANHLKVVWHNPSDTLKKACQLSGLNDLMGA